MNSNKYTLTSSASKNYLTRSKAYCLKVVLDDLTIYKEYLEAVILTVSYIKSGETYNFNLTSKVGFRSDNEAVVKVENGIVKAIAIGTAKVTVYLVDNESVSKTVNVTVTEDAPQPSLVIDSKIELFLGDELVVPFELKNSTASVTFESMDTDIVTVDGNKITAVGVGVGSIKVSVEGLSELGVNVQVVVKGVPEIVLTGATNVTIGSEIKLEAELKYVTGDVEWSTSDASIATVANGTVKGIAKGTATITAKVGELSATIDVQVNEEPIKLEGPTRVYLDEEITLTATFKDEPVEGEWMSADGTVATVTDGKVKGVRIGNVTISITSGDLYGELIVEVCEKPTLEIKGRNVVYVGKTIQLEAVVTGSDANVVWSSSNDKVATVDNGLVTGLTTGVIFLNVSIEDVTVKYKITCMEEPDQVVLEYDGGVSTELYQMAATPVTTLSVDNFNYNQGAFWANENYRTYVFMGQKNSDPGATFSDRIYIGRDSLDGYYKVISILLSGGSSWPDGAEYVITVSSSYKNYRPVDAQCKLISVGDIVISDLPYDKNITLSNPAHISFYSPKTDAHEIMIPKETFTVLPTPTRLGYEFTGWADKDGNIVETVNPSEISGSYELTAQWNELNPVTMIVVTNLPKELTKGTKIVLDVMLIPDDAYFKTVFFASSNTDVITVDKDGNLVAVNAGEATVTVTDFVGRVSKQIKVTVYPQKAISVKFEDDLKEAVKEEKNLLNQ